MSWAGKRVLVTGAGGFIGSHLAEYLVEAGAETRALVHYNALGSWGWLDRSPHTDRMDVVTGDICDRDSVYAAVEGVQIIFHLAALVAIPYSYRAPESYARVNIGGTLNVLQAAREHAVERVVHTSTSEVYGTAQYVPIDESHPLQGQSPYSASKIAADKFVEAFTASYDVPAVTVRPFNTFGPRQSARAIIPTIMSQCLAGDSLRLGNLHPTRDLNFVSNTVEGFVAAALAPDVVGKTLNLGSGREVSIEKLVRLITEMTGRSLDVEVVEERQRPPASEVDRLLADESLARSLLQWTPRCELEEGLSLTLDWSKDHIDAYRPGVYAV